MEWISESIASHQFLELEFFYHFIIGQRIIILEMKSITQNQSKNDPINRQIKAFNSVFSKIDIRSSSNEFSLFSRPSIDFKHSSDVEMSIEHN